jgi:hypothetical protein
MAATEVVTLVEATTRMEVIGTTSRNRSSLLEKGAIEMIEPGEGFVSGLFVIPKRTGGFRPVGNLKALNKFVRPVHFEIISLSYYPPSRTDPHAQLIILLKLTLGMHTSPSLYARRIGSLCR